MNGLTYGISWSECIAKRRALPDVLVEEAPVMEEEQHKAKTLPKGRMARNAAKTARIAAKYLAGPANVCAEYGHLIQEE